MTIVDIHSLDRVTDARRGTHGRARRVTGWHLGHRRLLAGALGAVVMVAAWLSLAPAALGGADSYVTVYGTSMLPAFHAGDLVVLRQAPSYHVGEIAGYHNGQLGVVVMHKIIAIHGTHYVFKGINNPYVTNYEPTKSQIVGAEWVHLPGAGTALKDVRTPIVAAVALGLLWMFAFASPRRSRRRRRRHRHAS